MQCCPLEQADVRLPVDRRDAWSHCLGHYRSLICWKLWILSQPCCTLTPFLAFCGRQCYSKDFFTHCKQTLDVSKQPRRRDTCTSTATIKSCKTIVNHFTIKAVTAPSATTSGRRGWGVSRKHRVCTAASTRSVSAAQVLLTTAALPSCRAGGRLLTAGLDQHCWPLRQLLRHWVSWSHSSATLHSQAPGGSLASHKGPVYLFSLYQLSLWKSRFSMKSQLGEVAGIKATTTHRLVLNPYPHKLRLWAPGELLRTRLFRGMQAFAHVAHTACVA